MMLQSKSLPHFDLLHECSNENVRIFHGFDFEHATLTQEQ